jgi:Entner-Doudoroff aldolase
MNMIFDKLYEYGIIPVVTLERVEDALPVARALAAGGLPVAEITFRTPAAADAIKLISSELPDFTVGAGTVLTPAQAYEAIKAGAKFVVAPGMSPAVAEYCLGREIPFIPGCATPTEIESALGYGLSILKFFPAETLGGIAALRALAAPYSGVKFVPTGGIYAENLVNYISDPAVLAIGSSFMVKNELITVGNYSEVTALTRTAMLAMFGFSLVHVGINCADSADAEAQAEPLCALLGLQPRPTSGAVFVGGLFELMREKYLGEHGHIAIGTNTLERAMKYVERMGYEFDPQGLKYTETGKLNAAYIKGDFAGFALHLIRK